MGRSLVLPLCAAALLAGCVGAADEAELGETDVRIDGTVRDEATERPISGAEVVFVSDALEEAKTHSDGKGRFELRVTLGVGIRFGTLRASHPDYRAAAAQSVYFDEAARTVDLWLRAK